MKISIFARHHIIPFEERFEDAPDWLATATNAGAVPFAPVNPLGSRFWLSYYQPVCDCCGTLVSG